MPGDAGDWLDPDYTGSGYRPPTTATSKPKVDPIDAANAQTQANFVTSQAFSQAQFEWQQSQAYDAQRKEDELRSNIAAAIKDVNNLFSNREPIYDSIKDATYDLNETALIDDRGDAKRQTSFSLARAGLGGGSVDTEKNAEIQDRFNDGIVDARSFASDASTRARAQDESLRSSLLSQALSGSSSGSDITQAAQGQLSAVANSAPSVAPSIATGDYYSGIANSIGQFASLYGTSTATPYGGQSNTTVNPGGGSRYYGSVS